jgi:ectoine hydroxylase
MSVDVECDVTASDPYWSRTPEREEIVDRLDPVHWQAAEAAGGCTSPGDGDVLPSKADNGCSHGLCEAEAASFVEQGFLAMPGFFSAEQAQGLLQEAQRLADEADVRRSDVITEPGSAIVRSLFQVHKTNEVFRAIAKDPRIVRKVEQLLGSEVYIHQSRINFKPAFDGKEFFWHSDFETWHMEDGMPRMRAISVSISLTDNNEFNGPLMVVPGSHRFYVRCLGATPDRHFEQSLKKQRFGVPGQHAMRQLVQQGGITAPKGPPGSMIMFDCNLMHGSAGNLSPYPRTNLFLVYNSVENKLRAPFGETEPRPEFLAEREAIPIDQL